MSLIEKYAASGDKKDLRQLAEHYKRNTSEKVTVDHNVALAVIPYLLSAGESARDPHIFLVLWRLLCLDYNANAAQLIEDFTYHPACRRFLELSQIMISSSNPLAVFFAGTFLTSFVASGVESDVRRRMACDIPNLLANVIELTGRELRDVASKEVDMIIFAISFL